MESSDEMSTPPIIEERDEDGGGGFWSGVGKGLTVAGRLAGRTAADVGLSVAWAYKSIDPDMRRHLAQMPVVGLSMLTPRAREPEARPDDFCNPIVFVHGMGGNSGHFVALRAYFKAMGRTRTYALDLGQEEDLEAMAARLRGLIAGIVECNELGPGAQLDVVAHSMGGIVSRVALEDPTTASRIATLVTLGTPHCGTHIARYASTTLTRAMRPRSPVMERLEATLPWGSQPGYPRLVALWSQADMIILPPEGACVEGATNIEMAGFSHFGYLLHPRGWETIYRALRRPLDTSYAPEDDV